MLKGSILFTLYYLVFCQALSEKKLECDRGQREMKKVLEEMEQLQEEVAQKKEQYRLETLNLYQRINSLETQVTTLKEEKSSMSFLSLQNVKEYVCMKLHFVLFSVEARKKP